MRLGDQHDHMFVRGLDVSLQLIFRVSLTKQQDDDARLWGKILSGDDEIYALQGHSTLYGFGGDDVLEGTGGFDFLNGGKGHDILYGRLGADTLTGGHGTDYFLYKAITDSFDRAADTITDFSHAEGDKSGLTISKASTLRMKSGSCTATERRMLNWMVLMAMRRFLCSLS